jgi:hypothetical protein
MGDEKRPGFRFSNPILARRSCRRLKAVFVIEMDVIMPA